MDLKMNLSILTKNHAADPEIGFLTKSISKPYGRATAIPTAWELTRSFFHDSRSIKIIDKIGSILYIVLSFHYSND